MPLPPNTAVGPAHTSVGEKHSRAGDPISPHAAIIEIIHGITQPAAAQYAADRLATAAWVHSPDGLAALLRAPSLRARAHVLLSMRSAGPADAGVVQLVARDGALLIFTDTCCAPLSVTAETGRRVCAGDALLFRRPEAPNSSSSGSGTVPPVADACVVFMGICPAALVDAADWALAAGANAMACAGFARRLLACPPGIAQLTCIAQIIQSPGDVWTRVLQLPLLLQCECASDEKERKGHVTEMRETQWIRRVVHSLLRIIVIALSSAEAIVHMPRVAREVTHAFLASPLFVDGVTLVLPRLAGAVTESTWAAVQQTMQDAVNLALRTVCRDEVDSCTAPHGSAEAERHAERGCLTVLYRLTKPSDGYEPSPFPGGEVGSRGPVPQAGQRAMAQLVAELARSGALRRVAHWLRHRERATAAPGRTDTAKCPPNLQDIRELHGLGANTVAEMIHAMTQTYSPYLRDEPGRFAESAMLAAYAELYGPAARAACRFIELVTSSSSSSSSSAFSSSSASSLAAAAAGGGGGGTKTVSSLPLPSAAAAAMRGLRIVHVVQPALRSSLDAYTLSEVEMHALFGIPMRISFGMAEVPARDKKKTFDMQLQELIAVTRDSSLFAIIVIFLHEKTFVFPVILSNVTLTTDHRSSAAAATAYVLRDRDMLPSLLTASAAAGNPSASSHRRQGNTVEIQDDHLPSAWLLYTDAELASGVTNLSGPSPRLFPRGTPAVSYILYIQHVYALLARLRRDEQHNPLRTAKTRDGATTTTTMTATTTSSNNNNNNNNNSNSIGSNSSSSSSSSGPLWWRAAGASTAAADYFAADFPFQGEADAAQRCVSALAGASSLTAAQVECLHTLSVAGPGVRALQGAAGSGKTAVACAVGLTRGRSLAALRAQHQPQWLAALRRSAQGLSARLEELALVEDVAELFGAGASHARETLEDAAGAAAAHAREHILLSERLQHCHAPLLFRPRAQRAVPPPSRALRVLCAPLGLPAVRSDTTATAKEKEKEKEKEKMEMEEEGEEGDAETEREEEREKMAQERERALGEEFRGVDEVFAYGHRRALHAPLVAVLRERMAALRRIGDHCDRIRRAAEKKATGKGKQEEEAEEADRESGQLCEELLPWLMARRERCESLAEATRREKSWVAYIADDLWDDHSIIPSYKNNNNLRHSHNNDDNNNNNDVNDKDNDDQNTIVDNTWMCLNPVMGEFRSVELPSATRGLCVYGREEALAWRTVFAARQCDLAAHLQHAVLDEAQQIFLLLHDVVCAVAAAPPPTARGGSTNSMNTPTVISATGSSLLRALPLLRAYRPRVLVIDDYDQLSDALFLALAPSAAVILTQQAEAPLPHERHAAGAILSALRRTIGASPLASSASLAVSQRFISVSLHTAVQLCRNAHIDTRRAAIRAAAAALVTDSSRGNGGNSVQPITKGHATSRHARNQAKNQPKNVSGGEVVVKSESSGKTDHRLPGFSSPSCVELWTHAVPLHAAIAADACAAAFIRRHILSVDDRVAVSVFTPFPADTTATAADVSFPLFTSEYMECDSECDIAVLCMSGIASRIASLSGNSRDAQWARAAESPLVEWLEWWLWRAMGRARRGAVLVGSFEAFDALPPLRRIALFVAHEREASGYWLPPEAQAAVLAICCPDHERAREIALVSIKGESQSGAEPFIQLSGAQRCRSLCLKPYDRCGNPSHACLRACHALRSGRSYHTECQSDGGVDSACLGEKANPPLSDDTHEGTGPAHAHCPFPCGRAQPCGHVCVRRCGDACEPCEFTGLYELPCGQRVVCGTADAGGPAFALVRHFQRVRCGEPPRPCDARVTLRCVRCGTRSAMKCHDAVAKGGMEVATLSERECLGCIAIYNRVASEFGAMEFQQDAETGAGELPVDTFSEEAIAKLQKLRGFSARKAQLMLQTEALEAMQGRPDAECNQLRRAHAEQREQQAEELKQHKQRVQEAMQGWAKTLREKYERQMGINEEMETEVPLMVSQAVAEAERQEAFHFA